MSSAKVCQRKDCGKEATTLECPKCKSLNLTPSYFCSQECFKADWPVHKFAHQGAEIRDRLFQGYEFSGPLRPGIISPQDQVPEGIQKPDYWKSGDPISERNSRSSGVIVVHTPEQIKKIRHASKLGREVLDLATKAVRVGITTDEIDKIVYNATIERNAYPSPLNYRGFPKSCCTSINEVICHGIPDNRPLKDGDIVNVDVSLYYDGVHTDLNETVCVGNVDEAGRKLVKVTEECLTKAIEACKPGTMYRDLGNVISKHATANNFSVVRDFTGHGTNELFHCAPTIPHYAKNKAIGVMKAGNIFTIEPMINEGTYSARVWPDEWTATTKDGKRSAQFEHMILVTETGCEVLTARTAPQ